MQVYCEMHELRGAGCAVQVARCRLSWCRLRGDVVTW